MLTEADLLLSSPEECISPKGQEYAYQPRSSSTGSPPYISRMGPIGKIGHSLSAVALALI